MNDLFGNAVLDLPVSSHANRKTICNGYARPPGTGPAGETCKTCQHATATGPYNRTFYKCAVIRHRWTHGPGTDIRLKSAACELWQVNHK